jgi:hypothetical protein
VRNFHIDIFQVVNTCATDGNSVLAGAYRDEFVGRHRGSPDSALRERCPNFKLYGQREDRANRVFMALRSD